MNKSKYSINRYLKVCPLQIFVILNELDKLYNKMYNNKKEMIS